MKRELSAAAMCSVLFAAFFASLGSEAIGAASGTGPSATSSPQPTPTPSYELKCLGVGVQGNNGMVRFTNQGLGSVPAGTRAHWYVSSTPVTLDGKQVTLPPVDAAYTFGQTLTAGGMVTALMPTPTPGPKATGPAPFADQLGGITTIAVVLANRTCAVRDIFAPSRILR